MENVNDTLSYEEKIEKLHMYYTAREQVNQTMEELAELVVEMSKANRGFDNRDAVIEEMADVLFCFEYITRIFSISEKELNDMMKYKIDRQLDRMNKEKLNTTRKGEK